jgi:hypothetical protein
MTTEYWAKRKNHRYYRVVREWIERLGPAESIMDVGSADTPIATWGEFGERYAVDPRMPPALPWQAEVTCIRHSWPAPVGEFVDRRNRLVYLPAVASLVTCCQVLEHLEDDQLPAFCESLRDRAEVLLVTVPYKWRPGLVKSHRQDPVNEAKLARWTGREPDHSEVVREDNGCRRLLAVYL